MADVITTLQNNVVTVEVGGVSGTLLSDLSGAVAESQAAAASADADRIAAEAAREEAQAFAAIGGFASRALAITAEIAAPVQYVRTAGYTTAGDGGSALYKRVGAEPSHAGKFQSDDGAWWELAEPNPVVEMFGAAGNDENEDGDDDLQAFEDGLGYLAARGRGVLRGSGRDYYLSGTLTLAYGNASDPSEGPIILDLCGGQLRSEADAPLVHFGAPPATADIYRGFILRNGCLRGAGSSATNNRAITLRNASYCVFENLRLTNFGAARPILIEAYGRGCNYILINNCEMVDNLGLLEADTGSEPGGYINDVTLFNIRAHENGDAVSNVVHCLFKGAQGELNGWRFIAGGIECQNDSHTLVKIERGESFVFSGMRLDGNNSTKVLDIAAGCSGHQFFGLDYQGVVVDAGSNFLQSDFGADDYPRQRWGSLAGGNGCYEVGVGKPATNLEYLIDYLGTDGLGAMRLTDLVVMFGPVESGSAAIRIDTVGKFIDLRTLGSTAIGSGPYIRFDGQFSSSGNNASCTLRQVGLRAVRLQEGRFVSQRVSFANADTTPSVAQGNFFKCANTGATTITAFDDQIEGHEWTILLDANTTIQHGSGIKLAGGANITGTANDTIRFVSDGTVAYELARSVNG